VIPDISATGAEIELESPAGASGDTIEIKGKFKVANIQRILSIDAPIRSVKTCTDGEAKEVYGVQFQDHDEDNMLMLFGFVLNEMMTGNTKHIK